MDRVGNISKNALALITSKIATSVLTFFLLLVINRNLGPEKAGIYTYALVLYTLFQVIPDFGIGNISIRDISQDHKKIRNYFNNIVILRFIMGLGAMALLVATNTISITFQGWNTVGWEKFWVALTIGFCLLFEQPISNTLAECFIALERLTLVAFVYFIMGVVKVGLSLYVLIRGQGNELVLLMLIYILTVIYSIFHFYIAYRRTLKHDIYKPVDSEDLVIAETLAHRPEVAGETAVPVDVSYASIVKEDVPEEARSAFEEEGRFKLDKDLWLYILKSAWPLAVASAAVTIYAGIDIPIISWVRGDQQVGMYSAATMFAKAAIFLTLALNMAILPAISKVGGKFPERLGEIWERIMGYLLVMIIPISVILPVMARPVLIIQKHNYISALPAAWLTMGAMIFTFLSAVSFPFFIVVDKQRKMTAIVVTGIAVKLIMNIIAIPIWGYIGAASVMILSDLIVFSILFNTLRKEFHHKVSLLKFASKPAISIAVMYPLVLILQYLLVRNSSYADSVWGSIVFALITGVVALIVYAVVILLTKQLNKKDLDRVNRLLEVEE